MQIKFVWKKGIFLHMASLSKEMLQGLLRGKLGFNGMITTDATNMVGFGCAGRRKELLPKSINAGCDMLLFTKNLKEDYETVLEAVKRGIISEERLNEVVTYILATKASLKLHEKQKSRTDHRIRRCHQCQRKTGSGRPPIGYDAPWFVHEIPTMFISIANPYHMQDVPMIETFINAYTANEFNVEMLVKKINGESSFKGKNPVDPFCYQRQTRTI